MKSIGFIDYYLNEWHADNYPEWIKEQSGGEFEVKYAYGHIEPPLKDRISNEEWAIKNNIELLSTIDELIEKSDCIIVLSPDNSEMHYELSKQALTTGKCVYIDKTFADSRDEAKRIFAVAEANNTPCFSSSALRFSKKLAAINTKDINTVISFGGGAPKIYMIHQIEQIATLMGTDVDCVMYNGDADAGAWTLSFNDGRKAYFYVMSNEWNFSLKISHSESNELVAVDDEFFKEFIYAMIEFFRTGEIPVKHSDTVLIMAIRAKCIECLDHPGEWLKI